MCNVGCPKVIRSDCAAEFLARIIKHLSNLCSIEHKYLSGYSPFAQGKIESAILEWYLRAVVVRYEKRWTEMLKHVVMAYNNAPIYGTTITPFMLVYGRMAWPPCE